MCVACVLCVCLCVCERERQRETDRQTERERERERERDRDRETERDRERERETGGKKATSNGDTREPARDLKGDVRSYLGCPKQCGSGSGVLGGVGVPCEPNTKWV